MLPVNLLLAKTKKSRGISRVDGSAPVSMFEEISSEEVLGSKDHFNVPVNWFELKLSDESLVHSVNDGRTPDS